MKIVATIILGFIFSVTLCYSQKMNILYYGVSSDSVFANHQLEFKNDTLLEISSMPRHMSAQFKIAFNYKRENNSIMINKKVINSKDSLVLINFGFSQFLNSIFLIMENKALLDEINNIVYVLYNDFKDKYYLTYLIDNKVYKQESGFSDSYGLIKNSPKENKELKDKLNSINEVINDYDFKVYRGLEAYRRFGYMSVFGVFELKRRT
ncbi:MAG TPA: hypothetical protein PLZ68_20140 [Ferruginibacter sp.]|nr:hypothetical protein [Ferruginibacter sp.]